MQPLVFSFILTFSFILHVFKIPRFRPNAVKAIIQTILNEELSGKQYDATLTPLWSRTIADKIKHKIKGIIPICDNVFLFKLDL